MWSSSTCLHLFAGSTHKLFPWLRSEEMIQLREQLFSFPFSLFNRAVFQPVQHKKNKREVGAQAGLATMLFSADTQILNYLVWGGFGSVTMTETCCRGPSSSHLRLETGMAASRYFGSSLHPRRKRQVSQL